MNNPYGLAPVKSCHNCSLHAANFFCRLSAPTLEAFEGIKQSSLYPRGAMLFSEAQRPRGVYMLCQGRVKLSVCAADGKMLILQIVQAGELLGLSANVSNLAYECTAETIEPCQIDFIHQEDFLHFLRDHGDACFRVAEHLSTNYHTAYEQIRSLGLSHSALEKLARLLLEWCNRSTRGTSNGISNGNGNGNGNGHEIRLKMGLTHEEISRMIGTSRETVSRLFRELKDRETIYLKGSTLIVRDKAALEGLINN